MESDTAWEMWPRIECLSWVANEAVFPHLSCCPHPLPSPLSVLTAFLERPPRRLLFLHSLEVAWGSRKEGKGYKGAATPRPTASPDSSLCPFQFVILVNSGSASQAWFIVSGLSTTPLPTPTSCAAVIRWGVTWSGADLFRPDALMMRGALLLQSRLQ